MKCQTINKYICRNAAMDRNVGIDVVVVEGLYLNKIL